jgi:hypothetical protein
MGVTTRYALRYPELDDPDDVPTDMLELATDVDAAIFGASVPKPVVNGQWLKGVGGAAVWSALTAADVSGLAKVTASPWAGGPPASPATGDIWIATDVIGGLDWQFRYDNAQATYKWVFIGGPPQIQGQGSALSIPANVWTNVIASTLQIKRAGVYYIGATYQLYNPNGTTAAATTTAIYANTAGNPLGYSMSVTVYANGNSMALVHEHAEVLAANTLLGVAGYTGLANSNFGPGILSVLPVQII